MDINRKKMNTQADFSNVDGELKARGENIA